MTKMVALWLGIFLLCAPAGLAQKKKDPATRSVSGVVTTSDAKLAVGAVVQLKDTKTKVVRSFYTVPDKPGEYYFHGLSPDTDYELSATFEGVASGTKTLSVFDTRKDAVIDLKLNPKK